MGSHWDHRHDLLGHVQPSGRRPPAGLPDLEVATLRLELDADLALFSHVDCRGRVGGGDALRKDDVRDHRVLFVSGHVRGGPLLVPGRFHFSLSILILPMWATFRATMPALK